MSTSAATRVQVLALPTSIGRSGSRRLPVARSLPVHGLVEEPESVGDLVGVQSATGRQPDGVGGSRPLDVVAGMDSKLLSQVFGNRHLKFARDFCHILTLSRMDSLSTREVDEADIVSVNTSLEYGEKNLVTGKL